jgi:hypothetical protein
MLGHACLQGLLSDSLMSKDTSEPTPTAPTPTDSRPPAKQGKIPNMGKSCQTWEKEERRDGYMPLHGRKRKDTTWTLRTEAGAYDRLCVAGSKARAASQSQGVGCVCNAGMAFRTTTSSTVIS